MVGGCLCDFCVLQEIEDGFEQKKGLGSVSTSGVLIEMMFAVRFQSRHLFFRPCQQRKSVRYQVSQTQMCCKTGSCMLFLL